jgi:hypothetical protein
MAKFPVELGDTEGIIEAVNYTLSGPAGLGQNFQGASSNVVQGTNDAAPYNDLAYMTGNFRTPFVSPDYNTATYVAPIALATSEYLDSRTILYTFAEDQIFPPFSLGNNLFVENVNDIHNGRWSGTGVIISTSTSVTIRITGDGKTYPKAFGGTISYNAFGFYAFVSTDMGAKVTVNSGSDRVFISGQLNNVFSYTGTVPSNIAYTVMINRRSGFPNSDPTNPEYVFGDVTTIATKTLNMTADSGSGSLPPNNAQPWHVGPFPLETIFANVIDTPPVGYYWYILELEIDLLDGDAVITQSQLFNRSISVQVVKQ